MFVQQLIGQIKLNGEEKIMPNVGGKKYSYSEKGKAQARVAARKLNTRMTNARNGPKQNPRKRKNAMA